MARGKERMVRCEKCGREVRRDKAVYIEKNVFSVPIDRKDVTEPEYYKRAFFREVAYCPGCGKHLRIYEKKIRENIRNKERAERRQFSDNRPRRPGFRKWSEKDVGQAPAAPAAQAPAAAPVENPNINDDVPITEGQVAPNVEVKIDKAE